MKKLWALILAAVLVFGLMNTAFADTLSDIKAKGSIKIGSSVSFPPYEFFWTNPETGEEEFAGFDMSMAYGLAEYLGVEADIEDKAFAGLVNDVAFGEVDIAISGIAIKPERLEVVDFSDPYFSGSQILLVRAEDYDNYKTAEDLAGKVVGAQTGSLQQGILESQFAASEPFVIADVPLLALNLVQGNIDGWLITDLVAKQYMAVYTDKLQISEVPVDYDSSAGIGIAVAKGGDNAALLAEINAYIAQITANGTFDQWVDEAAAKSASLLAIEE